ncbi:response regulator [Flavobacterium sp. RHBU_3]|uniref:response regulator n=1 Tax=Flavobacterium sp. RHBU_3 TaxID=3391184 RepID=UPI00398487B1
MERLTIFYTDDDLEDLDFFREIVDSLGEQYEVVTQNSGMDLLHALHNPPPHPYLIFLDINMPGMNGLETLKRVRENDTHRLMPIIMISTSNDISIIEKARLFGATYYLPKSGDFDKLKNSIEYVLSVNWGSFITTDKNFVYHNY